MLARLRNYSARFVWFVNIATAIVYALFYFALKADNSISKTPDDSFLAATALSSPMLLGLVIMDAAFLWKRYRSQPSYFPALAGGFLCWLPIFVLTTYFAFLIFKRVVIDNEAMRDGAMVLIVFFPVGIVGFAMGLASFSYYSFGNPDKYKNLLDE